MKTSLMSLAATLLFAASFSSASARDVKYSAVNVNGNWFYCGQEMDWCKGGAFNSANLGIITSLELGGQSQVSTGSDWHGGTMTMGYTIDEGPAQYINLTYYSYTGTYNQLQSGGSSYSNTTIDISSLSFGKHTIAVWFQSEDTYDSNYNNNYKASFVKLEGNGTETTPYLIKTTDDLDALAVSVNNGTEYEGVYFKLENSLDYTGKTYTPIGKEIQVPGSEENIERFFSGIFDGNFKTISGITIESADNNIGVFGYVLGSGSVIKNLIVTNCRFSGNQNVGGIAGYDFEGQIMGCFISDDVYVTGVNCIGGIAGYSYAYIRECLFSGTISGSMSESAGGIAGFNEGSIEGCYSNASITGGENSLGIGGIAGTMTASSSISDCIFEGTITGKTIGGILGATEEIVETAPYMTRNYYNASDVKGVGDAKGGYDIIQDDGALPSLVSQTIPFSPGEPIYEDDYYSVIEITAYKNCLHYLDNYYFSYVPLADQSNNKSILTKCINTSYNRFKIDGRTLYKTGEWNTLCLPFSVSDNDLDDEITFSDTPLEGAIVKTLESSTLSNDGTLTLNFSDDLTSIEAGKAYIVRWETSNDEDDDSESFNIQDPIFSDVTVTCDEHTNSFEGNFDYLFLGCFDPYSLTPGDQSELYLGAENTLYYAAENSDVTIGAFRGYFQKTIPVSTPIKAFVLNFGDDNETTSIKQINNTESATDTYYTLDGRRLNDKPATAGLYIINGKKVVIK